jgi:hypothetical protein
MRNNTKIFRVKKANFVPFIRKPGIQGDTV